MPYAHNQIASRLRKFAEKSTFTTRYAFEAAQDALRNLDLSPDGSPKKQVRISPIGPGHAPTHLRIQGLHQAAASIMHHTAQLQCRIIVRTMAFPAVQHDGKKWRHTTRPISADAWESLWMPVDLVPQEGLLAPIPKNVHHPDSPQMHLAIVEWRQVEPRQLHNTPTKYKSPNRKPRLLKTKTIVRLAAFSTPLGTLQTQPIPQKVAARRRYQPTRAQNVAQGHTTSPSLTAAPPKIRPHLLETQLYLRLAMRGQFKT